MGGAPKETFAIDPSPTADLGYPSDNGSGAGSAVRLVKPTDVSVDKIMAKITATRSTGDQEGKLSDWADVRSRSKIPAEKYWRIIHLGAGPRNGGARSPLPPAWKHMALENRGERCSTAIEPDEWKEDDGRAIHAKIREAMKRVEGISGELAHPRTQGDIIRGSCTGSTSMRGTKIGGGGAALGGIETLKSSTRRRGGDDASVRETSIKGLHDSLTLSMELVNAGESSTSANAAAMEDISAWLSHLAQRQLINIRHEKAIDGTSMADIVLAEGLGVRDCIREHSEMTSFAYKRLTSIFKNASAERERALRALTATSAKGVTRENEEGNDRDVVVDETNKEGANTAKKPRGADHIRRLQKQQLQEAAKNTEEAEALIDQLEESLQALEVRLKKAESTSASLHINREKDFIQWKALALEYEIKIRFLESALAQEETKMRIAEQVHREEGLELHLEMTSRQREEARAGGQSSAFREQVAALTTKLADTNAQLTIAEAARLNLEQEQHEETERNDKLREQLSAKRNESAGKIDAELAKQANSHVEAMEQAALTHEEEIASFRQKLIGFQEAAEEEAGKREFEIKSLKEELEFAHQRGKNNITAAERSTGLEIEADDLREEIKTIDAKNDRVDRVENELRQSLKALSQEIDTLSKEKSQSATRVAELELEVERLTTKCKELVGANEFITQDHRRMEKGMREEFAAVVSKKRNETYETLATAEAERKAFLSRVLEAEAEAERYRVATKELARVLEEAKSAQAALVVATASEKIPPDVDASKPTLAEDLKEYSEVQNEALGRTVALQEQLVKANKHVEGLDRDLKEAKHKAIEAEDTRNRVREELEHAIRIEAQARENAEAAAAAATAGPSEQQEEMFKEKAILEAAMRELKLKLQATEKEMERLQLGWREEEKKVEMLELGLEKLNAHKTKMMEEARETEYQIQRMNVERATLQRRGAETSELLSKTAALFLEVERSRCADNVEHGAIHRKVVDMLSMLQEESANERIMKMNLARERIDAGYRTLMERIIKSMRIVNTNTTNSLDRVPTHLRRLLAIFRRPGITKAFLLYAKKTAAGEIDRYADEEKQTRASSASERTITSNDVSTSESPLTSAAMRLRPLRRAASLDYVVAHPQPTISGVVVIDDPEKRRQATFGPDPSARAESKMSSRRKRESGVATNGVRGSGQSDSTEMLRSATLSKFDQGVLRATKWRVHGDGEGIDFTLTEDSAVGRLPPIPARRAGGEMKKSLGGSDESISSTASAEAVMAADSTNAETKKHVDQDDCGEFEMRVDKPEAVVAQAGDGGPGLERLKEQLKTSRAELAAATATRNEPPLLIEETGSTRDEREFIHVIPGNTSAATTTEAVFPTTIADVEIDLTTAWTTSDQHDFAAWNNQRQEYPSNPKSTHGRLGLKRFAAGRSPGVQTTWMRPRTSPGALKTRRAVRSVGNIFRASTSPAPDQGFASRAQLARGVALAETNKVVEIAFEAGALERGIAACNTKLAMIITAKGEEERNKGGGKAECLASEERAVREKLAVLSKSKANAVECLTVAPLESVVDAMEMLHKMKSRLDVDDGGKLVVNRAAHDQLQRNLNSAHIVEVSAALGEALLFEREGIAPRTGASTPVAVPSLARRTGVAMESLAESKTTWNDRMAQQENQRRVAVLSKSLEASDIHDLQVLRRSLETQVSEAIRAGGTRKTNKYGMKIPIDDASRWHADLLELRLAAVSRAVNRKGGWRAAVYREDGGVDVHVDVEPWSQEDRVLMLQTVRDALSVQLMQVRNLVKGLEERKMVPGGDDPGEHIEAIADLHREVGLLWEGIGGLLRKYPEASTTDDVRGLEQTSERTFSDSTSLSAPAQQVSRMLRYQEKLDVAMDLEHLPMNAVIKALLIDVDRVRASTKYISSIKVATGPSAMLKPAPVIQRERSSLSFPAMEFKSTVDVNEPPEVTRPFPQTETESTPSLSTGHEEAFSIPDSRSGGNSFRDSASSDTDVQNAVGRDSDDGIHSHQPPPGQGKDLDGFCLRFDLRDTVETNDEDDVEEIATGQSSPGGEIITEAEIEEAWVRAREMEEIARGLRNVVGESEAVIKLLRKEVENLEVALADTGKAPSEANPRLAAELEKAMQALGEERDFLAAATRDLNASMNERNQLLLEVEDRKAKEKELQRTLEEVSEREQYLLKQIAKLQQFKAKEQADVEKLESKILDPRVKAAERKVLRGNRREKLQKMTDADGRLAALRNQYEDMWEKIMKSYKRVHYLPQISVNNKRFGTIREWMEADLAQQRNVRKKLESAVKRRGNNTSWHPRPRNHPQIFPWTNEFVSPVRNNPPAGNSGPNQSQLAVESQKRWPHQHGIGPGRTLEDRGGRSLGVRVDQREEITAKLLTVEERWSDKHSPPHLHLHRAASSPRFQKGGSSFAKVNAPRSLHRHQRHRHLHNSQPPIPQPTPLNSSIPTASTAAPYTPSEAPRTSDAQSKAILRYGFGIVHDGGNGRSRFGVRERHKNPFESAPKEIRTVNTGRPTKEAENNEKVFDMPVVSRRQDTRKGADDAYCLDVGIPYPYRRVKIAKVDFHNSIRRKSSNSEFVGAVGHPSSLNSLLQQHSRSALVESWVNGGNGRSGQANVEGDDQSAAKDVGNPAAAREISSAASVREPRQHTVSRCLGGEQRVGETGGGHSSVGDFQPGARGGRGRRRRGGGAARLEGGMTDLNNLHPAWRPKMLTRRQRVV